MTVRHIRINKKLYEVLRARAILAGKKQKELAEEAVTNYLEDEKIIQE